MSGDVDFQLHIANHASGQPILLVGEPAQLDLSLRNAGDTAVTLRSAAGSQSTLTLFLPVFCGRPAPGHVQAAGWTPSLVSGHFVLTYAGQDGTPWSPGEAIAITLGQIVGSGRAGTGRVQVNPANMGDVPPEATVPLTLQNPPRPGNASLREALQLSLEHQGSVYVSKPSWDTPLANTLFLNIKNVGGGALYDGGGGRDGDPQVIVSFVYGRTSGALAPDDDRSSPPPPGSIWGVRAALDVDTTGWETTNPDVRDPSAGSPSWVLEPLPANVEILGPSNGDAANVTFAFEGIVCLSDPGHTQMIVLLTGFRKNSTTAYDDATFVLDISKQEAPELYGVTNFNSLVPIITPNLPLRVPLRWTMYNVARVELDYSIGTQSFSREITYDNPQPLAYDRLDVPIHARIDGPIDVVFTLQAFDVNDAMLNSPQFTVAIEGAVFVDPRDQTRYPTILLGDKYWTARNLAYADAGVAANDRANEPIYGRLYTLEEARSPLPGWRLPTMDDWQDLVTFVGGMQQAYGALIVGGTSGFEAQLGGMGSRIPISGGQLYVRAVGEMGFYWTVSPANDPQPWTFILQADSKDVNCITMAPSDPPPPPDQSLVMSVRYVMDT